MAEHDVLKETLSNRISRRRLLMQAGMAGGALAIAGASAARATTDTGESTPVSDSSELGSSAGVDLTGQELNLYSARHYDTDQEFYDDFTKLTGCKINLIEAEADQLIERIKSEGANSPADVLLTVDAGRLWRAQDAGLLAKVESDILDSRIPENLRDPGEHWFGFSKRMRVLVYSKDRVDPASLSTYEDLADPKWAGKILVRSSSNVYNQSLVGALIEAHGLDETETWMKGLVANFARDPQGGDIDQITAVAAGEGDIAIVNHYYYLRLLNSTDENERKVAEATALFIPNQGEGERGVHVNISGAGVVATAPHPQAAVAFLEYLTGDVAQEIFAKGAYEYPIVDGLELDPSLAALGTFTADSLPVATFGANGELAQLIMMRAGWQ